MSDNSFSPGRAPKIDSKQRRDKPVEEEMSRAEWLADVEEAVTYRTPDPLAEHSE
jgi:hypothetical protein